MATSQIDLDDLDKFITMVIEHLQSLQTQIQNESFPKPNYLYNVGGSFRDLVCGISILLTNNRENVYEYQNFMHQFGRILEGTFKEIN